MYRPVRAVPRMNKEAEPVPDIVVSQEILTRLQAKLGELDSQLDAEENNLLSVLLAMGAEQAAEVVRERDSDVEGFGARRFAVNATMTPLATQMQPGKIFEITQDVTVNKAKTADKAFNAMDGYIRG